jgi:NADH dehydrogenase
MFKNKTNVQIRLAEVLNVDTENNKIKTTIGDFEYGYLVIAIGCKTNFFGNNDISKYSFTLKTTYDAITIRNHILQTFENIISADDNEKESLLNLIIVGAGPTGVELAGAFAEIKKNVLPKDYHGIDFSKFKIILIEGTKNTLNSMSSNAKIASRKYLQEMDVSVLTETFVQNYDGDILTLKNGNNIKTKTVIWTAGVTGNIIQGIPDNCFAGANRIKVNRINKVVGSKNIFALGDIAFMETPKYPKGHPQLANVAINQAKNLAKNFKRVIQGRETVDYEYKDLGSMATIGRNKAVVDFPFINFNGYFAWVIWMFLHLMLILSVKNKLIIFINWAWAYITKDTSLRLILTQNEQGSTK